MGSADRVVKNTGILYARMAITIFISLYSTRLLLNSLGVADFGIFNVVAGAIAMLTFLNNAMASATQRFISYTEGTGDFNKVRAIFNVSVVLHLLIAVLVLIILEGAGMILFNGILKIPPDRIQVAKIVFQFMVFSTLFTIISVPYDAVINAHENMLLYAILSIVEAVLKLGIAIYVFYAKGDKLTIYGALFAGLSILLLLTRRIYCTRKYPECRINPKKYFDSSTFREMASFAGWSFLGASSSMISNYGQGIVMNVFFGTLVNAAQGVASQVSGQLSAFAGTMLKALNPIIDKSEGAGEREKMLRASIFGSKISFFLLLFFYIPVFIEMPYIFRMWLKNVPPYVITFCQLLLIRNLIEQLFVTLVSAIAAQGNIKRYQILSSILSFFPLVLSFAFFKLGFPAYTLYVIFIIYSMLASCLILYFSKINLGLSIKLFCREVLLRSTATFFLIFLIAYLPMFFMDEGVIRLLTVCLLAGSAFAGIVWVVGLSQDERKSIEVVLGSLFRKIKRRPVISN